MLRWVWDHLLNECEQFDGSPLVCEQYGCCLMQRCCRIPPSSLYPGWAWSQTWLGHSAKTTRFREILKIELHLNFQIPCSYAQNPYIKASNASNRLEKAFRNRKLHSFEHHRIHHFFATCGVDFHELDPTPDPEHDKTRLNSCNHHQKTLPGCFLG